MSNFQFLYSEWPELFEIVKEAEDMVNTKPLASRMYCRQALEKGINWMYANDSRLTLPERVDLQRLLLEPSFKPLTTKQQRRRLMLLKDLGNAGVHGRELKEEERDRLSRFGPEKDTDIHSETGLAIISLKLLFEFLSFFAVTYSKEDMAPPSFDENLLQKGEEQIESIDQLKELENKLVEIQGADVLKRAQLEEQQEEIEALKAENELNRKEIVKRAQQRAKKVKAIPQLIPESVTRKFYIDALLKESGWTDLREGRELEYEVNGMPRSTNPSGIGYADYVLWGDDGKPLAVIEAKKTLVDASKGKHQATLYADCLEQMHGQRPLILYTNGFETYLWDDTFYPERMVSGFYTKAELSLHIERRTTRKDPRDFQVDLIIAGRAYQIEGIQRVAENLAIHAPNGKLVGAHRASLLVMATGSGKTRTAVALVDMLFKCNWVKRVLFLADRNALVAQAKNVFGELLPDLSAIDLTREKEDNGTRLVFSTYPTIMNKIDKVRSEEGRFYGPGHFDLIIIDEAHRSVYQKYRAIFEYFDSLLLGLTATPKKDIDHNTYGLFGIEDDDPTFAYELDQAVEDGFLVPPKSISVPLKFQREGIKYHELSENEKTEYEEKFGDPTTEDAPEEIGSGALNKWLFNTDTVDKVLEHLMNDGIKVSGGDKLGKTIIFAKNHMHAVFIEERFNKNYPEYSGKFLRVIDNYETKAQDLLEKFCDPYQEQDPQIAVSVDMMDTGVDAPRVANLVFFKTVKSASKFWQMIGRGTRLCPALFAPAEDKKEFLIFDYCENFEYFDEFPDGTKASQNKPLLQLIFESKVQIAYLIGQLEDSTLQEKEIRDQYLEELHRSITSLDDQRFVVRKELRYVNEYSNKSKWLNLSKNDIQEINKHLSHLQPASKGDDELARRFDILILTYQLALLTGTGDTSKYTTRIYRTAAALQKKDNIPQVAAQLPAIKRAQTESFWQSIDVKKLEELRQSLRDLIQFLEVEKQEIVYTHFEDEIDLTGIRVHEPIKTYTSLQSYRDRVERYVRENKHHITITKLMNNEGITKDELVELERIFFTESAAGTKNQFVNEYGEKPLGAFIRSITGLNPTAVKEAFSDFLQAGILRADQMTFVTTIMSYLTKNGTINKTMLYESPFTDLNDQGISGVFDNDTDVIKIVKIIDKINGNAMVA